MNWTPARDGPVPTVGPFAIVVLTPDSVAVEVLTGPWPSARVAGAYAETLTGITGWRVVPRRPAASP